MTPHDEQMYKENILDHSQHPHNVGALAKCTIQHREFNPRCGDDIEFFLVTDERGIVTKTSFVGKGCAISQASASMLSDVLVGKSLSEIAAMGQKDILEMLGIAVGPSRLKCALLSLKAVQKGITPSH